MSSSILPARSRATPKTAQRHRECAHRKLAAVADQLLDRQSGHQSAGAILARPAAVDGQLGPALDQDLRLGRRLWRSSILPRDTREHKLHIADTLSYEHGRMHWKFGGDFIQAWIYNYYPYLFGGEYYFGNVKVNPWTLRAR